MKKNKKYDFIFHTLVHLDEPAIWMRTDHCQTIRRRINDRITSKSEAGDDHLER